MHDVMVELKQLRLHGMAAAWADLVEQGRSAGLDSARWLIEHELPGVYRVHLPPDPQKLMKQVQQMQAKVQAEIAALEIEASSGGGMVKVVLDGEKRLRSIKIDPEVVDKNDVGMLEDLVLAAITEAHTKVEEAIKEKIGGLTAGMKIPGLM